MARIGGGSPLNHINFFLRKPVVLCFNLQYLFVVVAVVAVLSNSLVPSHGLFVPGFDQVFLDDFLPAFARLGVQKTPHVGSALYVVEGVLGGVHRHFHSVSPFSCDKQFGFFFFEIEYSVTFGREGEVVSHDSFSKFLLVFQFGVRLIASLRASVGEDVRLVGQPTHIACSDHVHGHAFPGEQVPSLVLPHRRPLGNRMALSCERNLNLALVVSPCLKLQLVLGPLV